MMGAELMLKLRRRASALKWDGPAGNIIGQAVQIRFGDRGRPDLSRSRSSPENVTCLISKTNTEIPTRS